MFNKVFLMYGEKLFMYGVIADVTFNATWKLCEATDWVIHETRKLLKEKQESKK